MHSSRVAQVTSCILQVLESQKHQEVSFSKGSEGRKNFSSLWFAALRSCPAHVCPSKSQHHPGRACPGGRTPLLQTKVKALLPKGRLSPQNITAAWCCPSGATPIRTGFRLRGKGLLQRAELNPGDPLHLFCQCTLGSSSPDFLLGAPLRF